MYVRISRTKEKVNKDVVAMIATARSHRSGSDPSVWGGKVKVSAAATTDGGVNQSNAYPKTLRVGLFPYQREPHKKHVKELDYRLIFPCNRQI